MKKMTILVLIASLFIIISIIGFMVTLNLNFIDAFYMTVITISTVGYESLGEMTNQAKIFSMFVIVFSVGLIGYILSEVFRFLSQGNINESWRLKKMIKQIETLKNHIIVCGAGESGIHVITELIKKHVTFVVIENDPLVIEQLKQMDCLYLEADATDEEILLKAGLKEAMGIITTLPTDSDNVFLVLTARDLNPKLRIISKCHESSSRHKLRRAGANSVISPDEIGGKKMANLMINPNVQFFVDNIIDTKNVSIDMEEIVIEPDSELDNVKLRNSKIADKAGLIVLAIRRDNDDFIFNPKAEEFLRAEDRIIVVGSKEQIKKLEAMAHKQEILKS